jgi:hypothetical protein
MVGVTVEQLVPQLGGVRIRRSAVLPRVGGAPDEVLFPASSPAESLAGTAPKPRLRVASPSGRARVRTVFVLGGVAAAVLLVTTPFLVTSSRDQPAGEVNAAKPRSIPNSAARPGAPAPVWPGRGPSPSVSTGTPGPVPPSGQPKDAKSKPPAKGKGPGGPSGAVPANDRGGSPGHAPARNAPLRAAAAPGKARELVSSASRRCIDVTGGKAKDGTPLEIWTCTGAARQKWTFRSDGSVRAMGLCMDLAWGSSDNGTQIQLADCNGGAAQKFNLNSVGDLINTGADKCVDVKDNDTASGTRLQLWDCTGGSNQKWSAV